MGVISSYFSFLHHLLVASIYVIYLAVRVWNSSWSLVSSFVGHLAPVTGLSTYPTGPCVMSSSEDCTIRVWNLETMDEMERQDTTGYSVGGWCSPVEKD